MQYLILLTGNAKGKAIKLSKAITMGRHKSCDLVIRLKQISRRHCKLSPTHDGGWVVTDLGTQNGTKVNGDKVIERRLADGDEIQVSAVRIKFRDEKAVPGPAKPPAASTASEEESEPTLAMHGEEPEMTEMVDVQDVLAKSQPPKTSAPAPSGGVRFGLGLAAGGDQAEAEGTAFMDMHSMMGGEGGAEGTEFVDMKDLMLEEPGMEPAGPKTLLYVAIGGLILVLVGAIVYKVTHPESTVIKLPDLVLEAGQKIIYPFPRFDRFEISNQRIVTGAEGKDRTTISLLGAADGSAQLNLHAGKKHYQAGIRVVVPLREHICREVRGRHRGKSIAAVRSAAAGHLGTGRSNYDTRHEHLQNLYRANEEVRKAWCLLEQMSTKPSEYYEAKKLLDTTEAELSRRFEDSREKIDRFIQLAKWKELRGELETVKSLFPDQRDWRHQRANAVWEYYRDKGELTAAE